MIGEKFGIFPSVWYAGLKCNYATDKYSYIVGIKVSNVVICQQITTFFQLPNISKHSHRARRPPFIARNLSSWSLLPNYSAINDPCESYDIFHNNLKAAIDKNFPFVKMKNKSFDHEKSPWMTGGVFRSISKKNRLFKTFFKKPSYRNETMYKKYKNKLNHVIKSAKKINEEKNVRKNYYQFLKYKNDMKMTWQTINKVLNRNKTREKLPDCFFTEKLK
jgi:hypothetical protein